METHSIALAGTGWENLYTLLVAAGYSKTRATFSSLTIRNTHATTDLIVRAGTLSAPAGGSNSGVNLYAATKDSFRESVEDAGVTIDSKQVWIKAGAAGTADVSFVIKVK